MRSSPFGWIFLVLMVALDFYVFTVIKSLSAGATTRTRAWIFGIYWGLSILSLLTMIMLPYLPFDKASPGVRNTVFATIMAIFFAKFIASFFFLIDDLRRGVQWLVQRFRGGAAASPEGGISRSVFLSWLGVAAGTGLMGSLVRGFGNKYKYQVRRVPLAYPNLPASFRGLRVVQLSDIHSGSFTDKAAVERGVQQVLDLKPDLILFTGDLVNNIADEMKDYADVFGRLQAPLGVYSVLGNHDYADYVTWKTPAEKTANLDKLKTVHAGMGWKLLLNEWVEIKRGADSIAILGVENWSMKARFPKYGKLADAHRGSEAQPFKILLSHDPSHWKGEVLPRYPDIDLMLAGHTHGMQFGVEMPGFRWSPVQLVYEQWAGLYEEGAQKLYVNRGFGFIGYPGRVGILPEITLFELG